MKPLFLKKNTQSLSTSFLSLKTEVPHIYDKWHYHEELELLYVIKGTGTRFIGDSVQEFTHGDIILVGPNLPHVWKNDKAFYSDDSLKSTVILIQFVRNFIGDKFFDLPEMQKIQLMIKNSERGIKIKEETKQEIAPLLEKLVRSHGSRRILLLLEVLEIIANSDYDLVASNWFSSSYMYTKNDRISKVYDHIMTHFNEKMTLEELASIANMNAAALCRYFKTSTNKTLTQFINEVRISFAFNLINTKGYTISQACYESGFNNLSYFNRQFKKIIGYSPSMIKKQYT